MSNLLKTFSSELLQGPSVLGKLEKMQRPPAVSGVKSGGEMHGSPLGFGDRGAVGEDVSEYPAVRAGSRKQVGPTRWREIRADTLFWSLTLGSLPDTIEHLESSVQNTSTASAEHFATYRFTIGLLSGSVRFSERPSRGLLSTSNSRKTVFRVDDVPTSPRLKLHQGTRREYSRLALCNSRINTPSTVAQGSGDQVSVLADSIPTSAETRCLVTVENPKL